MEKGTVVRAYGGFYFVQVNDRIVECSVRGRLKKDRFRLLVGDWVRIHSTDIDKGTVEDVFPRSSLLQRPLVANVDRVIITFAARNPEFSSRLLDRFLLLTEQSGMESIICINKADLLPQVEKEQIKRIYSGSGYKILFTCAKTGFGIPDMFQIVAQGISAFAGPSGVGKSSLLNALQPGLQLQTGEVSQKLKRGKHTTRFAQLLTLDNGGLVVDTPGFTNLELNGIEATDVSNYFPEINHYSQKCKFRQCVHIHEPACAVKQAVENGDISRERYSSYATIVQETRNE